MIAATERFRQFRHAYRLNLGGEPGEHLADFELERAANLAACLTQVIERADAVLMSGPDVDECRAELAWLAAQIDKRAALNAKQAELKKLVAGMNRGQRRRYHKKLRQKGIEP